MNRISSNEKFHFVYNTDKNLVFNSNQGKFFPSFKGIKFAELDKNSLDRIFLFNGELIEVMINSSSFKRHAINVFSDVIFSVFLYQKQAIKVRVCL